MMLYCDKAEKHGNLCLGYGIGGDEPCEICKNCIKCESGYYQLGETEKDNQLTKAKEIISEWEDSFCCGADYLYLGNKGKELRIKSQKFLNGEVEK